MKKGTHQTYTDFNILYKDELKLGYRLQYKTQHKAIS